MKYLRTILVVIVGAWLMMPMGCQEKKRSNSVTIEGPEKKTQIKVEKTEKRSDSD